VAATTTLMHRKLRADGLFRLERKGLEVERVPLDDPVALICPAKTMSVHLDTWTTTNVIQLWSGLASGSVPGAAKLSHRTTREIARAFAATTRRYRRWMTDVSFPFRMGRNWAERSRNVFNSLRANYFR
jgi:hypothetical protein